MFVNWIPVVGRKGNWNREQPMVPMGHNPRGSPAGFWLLCTAAPILTVMLTTRRAGTWVSSTSDS